MSGFERSEFEARRDRAQALMAQAGLGALLLTTEPEIRYYTGFQTRFWESPTRPWYVVLPASGDPVAVIPSIGAALMAQSWVSDIRTWRAPDLNDDGVTLLTQTLTELSRGAPVGMAFGMESHARMPLASLDALRGALPIRDDAAITRRLRLIKSDAEIAKIRTTCAVADRAFARVPEIARQGVGLDAVFRRFQMLLLEEGAEYVPYLAGASGADGYGDVISGPTGAPLAEGDVLMLDTGAVKDGYFCDFDRNFAIGTASNLTRDTHAKLIEATQAGFDAAGPGTKASALFAAMDHVCTGGAGGSDAGRLGHGLGMQLTEWPSLIPAEHLALEPGMVLTLEPGIETRDGRMMVHEENIVITATGAAYLSTPAGADIQVLA